MSLFRKPAHADATGDAIPFFHNGTYHIFSLTPPVGTGTYPERLRTTWHHVSSRDLIEWTDLGTALRPGSPGEPDVDGCWTGSVIFAGGRLHAYYTGYSIHADFPQTICHATSEDGVNWIKDPDNPCLLPEVALYESLDWRDPYVFYNDEDGCYWLILSARRMADPPTRRGCVVLYRSSDLKQWTHYGPIYEPGHTNCPECPELYRIGRIWYLAYSRFSEFGGTIYRVADSSFGPWRTPRRDRVGTRRFYAAKSVPTAEGHRYYFGWTPDRADRSDRGEWYWGGIFAAPHEAVPAADGGLDIRLPQVVVDAFREPIVWEFLPFAGESHADGKVIEARSISSLACGFLRFSEPRFLFSCKVRASDCRDHFGFVLKSDRELARCLLLTIEPATGRVSLVNFPYAVDPFWAASVASMVEAAEPGPDGPRVAEAFLDLCEGETIDVKILVDHSLVEVFIGESVALNYRWYGTAEHELGILVQDGKAIYSDIELRR